MRNHCLALGLACAAPAVLAEDFPARYDVTTNNGRGYELRAAPDASAPAIGQIPDDRQGLQVVRLSEGGDWGLVTYGERSAWVAMAHLTRQPAPQATALPMRCYGTEPFWGLNFPTGFFAEFERPEHPEEPFQIAGMAESTGSQGRIKAWSFISDASRATLTLRPEQCSDGMSDREFGLSAILSIQENSGEMGLFLGCCSLTSP